MTLPTVDQIAERIKSALNAALADIAPAGSVKAMDYDEIPGDQYGVKPGTVPGIYVAIEIWRTSSTPSRFSGDVTMPGYTLVAQYNADTVTDCRVIQQRVRDALGVDSLSVILDDDLGPFALEAEMDPPHREALGFSGTDHITFTA